MKLVRFGDKGAEKPGIIDGDGAIRDASGVTADYEGAAVSLEALEKLKGVDLLRQFIEPSSSIHERYRNEQFILKDGRIITGVVMKEKKNAWEVATNLLTPESLTTIRRKSVEERIQSKVSPMPTGLVDVLTRDEILDLHAFVEAGGHVFVRHIDAAVPDDDMPRAIVAGGNLPLEVGIV